MIFMNQKYETTKNKHISKKKIDVKVKVIMMSDSLSSMSEKKREKLDKSGKIAEELVKDFGYEWLGIQYSPDEIINLQSIIKKKVEDNVGLIVTIGGTGVGIRDTTIEAIRPLLDLELPGYGELFRYKTFKEVGTISIMTRTIAGMIKSTVIVCLPGSPNAVDLGLKIIFKEIQHLLSHRK